MIYNIPTNYCYDRHGDRWDWNEKDRSWQKVERPVLEEYYALNRLAQARGPLTDTPPITVGTVLDTAEKGDACPPGTVAHWPGTAGTAIKTRDGRWVHSGGQGTFAAGGWVRPGHQDIFTPRLTASALAPYTVLYVPEGDE